MRKIICAVIAAGLFAAGPFAGRARAEDEGKGKDGGGHERIEKMMKERLGLTDDQAAKLKAAWKAQKDSAKTLREESKATSRKLEEEVRDLASEKEIQATLDQLDANRKAMATERQKLEASVSSILRPSQRAKMRLMMAHMKRGGSWNRGGRGGDHKEDRKGGKDHEHHDDD